MIIKKRNKSGILCYWDDKANASKVKSRKEKNEQIDLNSACSIRYPEEYNMMFHVVNESGSGGSAQYGSELNKMGRKKGVPDWMVMIPAFDSCGLFVELKRTRKTDSSISKEQKDFLLCSENKGYVAIIAYGYLSALEAIEDYFKNKS